MTQETGSAPTLADVLVDASFRPAGSVDSDVPPSPGVYAIRLCGGAALPEPFGSLLRARSSNLIYIGKATSLQKRRLRNELRGRGHGTFFRSIGAILEFRPQAGSLATKVNKYNYSFEKPDRATIVEWINANLEVSWCQLPLSDIGAEESALILEHTPLINLADNPPALVELDAPRVMCREIASRPIGAF